MSILRLIKVFKKRFKKGQKTRKLSSTSLTFNRFNFPQFIQFITSGRNSTKKTSRKDFSRSGKTRMWTYVFYIFIFIDVIKNAGLAERGELGGREQRTRNIRGRRNPKKMDTFPILWRENRASLIANFRFAARYLLQL